MNEGREPVHVVEMLDDVECRHDLGGRDGAVQDAVHDDLAQSQARCLRLTRVRFDAADDEPRLPRGFEHVA